MRSITRSCAALTAAGALLAACGEPTAPTQARQAVGTLQLERSLRALDDSGTRPDGSVDWSRAPEGAHVLTAPQVIEAPDTVRVGEPFPVTVHTIGEDGCWSADGQELRVEDHLASIVPWDAHSGASSCTELLGYLAHTVEVTFVTRGTGIIRVTGSRRRAGDADHSVEITAERRITVR